MKKISLGQFFTINSVWLRSHIRDFILSTGKTTAYDPFAGQGDLLKLAQDIGLRDTKGSDIDETLGRDINDGLLHIPTHQQTIIITNPPYLTNYSAKRKGIFYEVEKYFIRSKYDDLYKIALDKCISSYENVVAIVPETFVNSNFSKNTLHSITILENNPFGDTENPVCVVCFDGRIKSLSQVMVYKNDDYFCDLGYLEELRLEPSKLINLSFNDIDGEIAIRAVDMPNPNKTIKFMPKNSLDYDLKGIKESSRLITIVKVGQDINDLDKYIEYCNEHLSLFRAQCGDLLLSPFKGNNKNGIRRRRLDYKTARAIMELSFSKINYDNTLIN